MMPSVRKGRNTHFLIQREAVFKQAPAADAVKLRFSKLSLDNEPERSDDTTINSNVLRDKSIETPGANKGSLSSRFCFNEVGVILTMMFGLPVTTGAGPYTHTFTLTDEAYLSFLAEVGYSDAAKFPRFLGNVFTDLSYPIMDKNAEYAATMSGAIELASVPSATFDITPTEYAKDYACGTGDVYHTTPGSSDLGNITSADVKVELGQSPESFTDGDEGTVGAFLPGELVLSGGIEGLFALSGGFIDLGESHTSTPLSLAIYNKGKTSSLTLTMANVEISRLGNLVETKKHLVGKVEWKAHAGGAAPTLKLVNGVSSYV